MASIAFDPTIGEPAFDGAAEAWKDGVRDHGAG